MGCLKNNNNGIFHLHTMIPDHSLMKKPIKIKSREQCTIYDLMNFNEQNKTIIPTSYHCSFQSSSLK